MHRLLVILVGCGVLAACSGSTPTGPSKTPTLSRTRFLAFGDSVTAGEITEPRAGLSSGESGKLILVPTASYPTLLQSQLVARYTTQAAAISMVNAGKPSETAQDGRTRLPSALAESQADVLLLTEGVNGLFIAGPDLSAAFVENMVQMAKGQTRVFVGSMIPTLPGRRNSQNVSDLEKMNSNLRTMAAAEGAVFVDLYNPMLAEAATLIGADGLHPTEAGYKRIADLFFVAIQANLESK